MDPLICLKRLIESYMNGDEAHTIDYAHDLIGWIESGGFTPHRARITMMLEAIVEEENRDAELLHGLEKEDYE